MAQGCDGRLAVVFLAAILAALMILTLPFTASGAGEAAYEGTYVGAYDAEGKRSGQGAWTYHNFYYEGNWENDMPNGEGTLYEGWEEEGDKGWSVVQGNWKDGFADGAILRSNYWLGENGWESVVFSFRVKKGFPEANGSVMGIFRDADGNQTEGEEILTLNQELLLGGVPPWAEAEFDTTAGPPSAGLLNLPAWDIAESIGQMEIPKYKDEAEGTYEGEYDESGIRNGQGIWTYYNYRYEGEWEGGRPNGRGTLYERRGADGDGNPPYVVVIQGNWAYGFAEGKVLISEHAENGDASFYAIDVKHGRSAREMWVDALDRQGGETVPGGTRPIFQDANYGAVPPWADADIDPAGSPPTADQLTLPSWTEAEGMIATLFGGENSERAQIARMDEGIYEGEYDESGIRNGQGIWTYYNYRYEGEWEGGRPNGRGTLYERRGADGDGNPPYVVAIQGNWVYGFAEGPVLISEHSENGDASFYAIDVKHGRSAREMWVDALDRQDGETMPGGTRLIFQYANYGAVPPWADADIDAAGSPPTSDQLTLPSWAEAEGMIATLFAGENSESAQFARMNEGTYVGGHDEYGKRSGFGTWAYYNYLYAGQWENDLPHGEGTLYSVSDQGEHIAHGEWQDGVAVGEVELVDIRRDFSGPERFFHYRKNAQAMPLNARGLFLRNYFDGLIPPGPGMELPAFVTPWYLYEKYPSGKLEYSPLEKIENTGMGKTPGNLANARLGGMQMAVLGDWIVLCVSQNDLRAGNTVHTLYKMRADGTQMTKIHEHDKNASGHWSPALQVIGDWLFVGEDWPGAVPPYKMRAEDAALTPDVGGYPPGLVVDEWVYQLSGGNTGASVYRYRTDNSGYTYLGHSEQKEVEVLDGVEWTFAYDYDSKVLFADKDWVYVHFRGTKTGKTPDGQKNESVADIVKFRNDESGEIEAHSLLSQGNAFVAFPQIVGGRLYYTEQRYSKNKAEPTVVFCVDLDFAQAPVAVVPGSKGHYINALHVTDDFLYYVDANDWGQGAKSSIVKANLDGSNPVVLADGLVGVNSLLIAGDWMMFSDNEGIDCLMRLDGSDLHRLKDALPTDTE